MARLLALHLLLRRLAAGRPRAAGREAERGQAVAEFAITVSLVLAVAVTALQMVPAISARGRVLDAAATATERAARYLAPGGLAPSDQRKDLCGQIRALLVAQLPAAGLPVTGSATGCAVPASGHRLAPTAGENLAVWVSALDPKSGEADPSLRLDPDAGGAGVRIEVCVAYRWKVPGGLIWLLSNGPGDIGSTVKSVFTYQFCGQDLIDATRTR